MFSGEAHIVCKIHKRQTKGIENKEYSQSHVDPRAPRPPIFATRASEVYDAFRCTDKRRQRQGRRATTSHFRGACFGSVRCLLFYRRKAAEPGPARHATHAPKVYDAFRSTDERRQKQGRTPLDAVLASLSDLRVSARGLNLKPEWATAPRTSSHMTASLRSRRRASS